MRLLFILPFLFAIPANGQSLWRNFFTTNQNPIVEVVAGSNATVQASTVGSNLRRFTVNSTATGTGSSQTNISWTAVTNLQSAEMPYSVITNAPWLTSTSTVYSSNLSGAINATILGTLTNNTTGSAAYAPIAGTATNNLLKAGDTATGPILTTSSTTNAPSSTEFATAGWVRQLFDGFGEMYYVTTNINNTFTNSDIATAYTNVYEFSTNIPVYSRRSYAGQTNGGYFGSVVTTNTFLQLNSGLVVNSYLESQNGTGTGGPQVKPEIYISYDRTNWFGDWDAQPQYIPEGSTNLYSWVAANPTYTSTNATGFYVMRRFKMVTQTTPAASDILVHMGTNAASHVALAGASLGTGNAYLAANQTWTGSNHFSIPLVSSLASNTPSANQVLTATSGGSAKWGSDGSGLTNLNAAELRSGTASYNVVPPISFVGGYGFNSLAGVGTTKLFWSPFGNSAGGTTEVNVSQVMPVTCYATNLYVRINTIAAGTNVVCELVTNGVASNLRVSINGNGSLVQGSDTANSVPIPAGTLVSFSLVGNNATPAANLVLRQSVQFVCRP